tara:strand:+ start:104 stop:721 length:618 start_codon:yes stop_codon:yes gene_type:complete
MNEVKDNLLCAINMNLFVFLSFCVHINGYIYHSTNALRQPHIVKFDRKISKDIKIIDEEDALALVSFWYNELKVQQEFGGNNERQNIEYLYYSNYEDYTKMSQITSFCYDCDHDTEHHNEYIIWKPRINPCYINDSRRNSIFYQDINHTLCLISFKCLQNKIIVENMVYTPFWRGDANIIQKKLKSLIVDYFLGHMKHQEVNFDL